MADTLRDNPFDTRDLPASLEAVVADLGDKINDDSGLWTDQHKDVFSAIRRCIIDRKPIDKELQDQYVKALSNEQSVNRYGQ